MLVTGIVTGVAVVRTSVTVYGTLSVVTTVTGYGIRVVYQDV